MDLLLHTEEDKIFSKLDCKAIFLNVMSIIWQQSIVLKGTQANDIFKDKMEYFNTFQSIIDHIFNGTGHILTWTV